MDLEISKHQKLSESGRSAGASSKMAMTSGESSLFELLQKPHIVIEHQTDIVERIHQRTHSLQAEAEGEAGIDGWVDADAF